MPKSKKAQNLSVNDVQPIEPGDPIVEAQVAEAVAEITDLDESRTPIGETALSLGALGCGKLDVRIYKPFKGFVNAMSFGDVHVGNKWHINSHFEIMGLLNAIAGARLGHYAVIEEGLHLKESFSTLRAKHLYEGTFGYVNFSKVDGAWLREFELRGLLPTKMNDVEISREELLITDKWFKFEIEKQQVKMGHCVAPRKLETIAKELGKSVDQLSPFTIGKYTEAWNTFHKREGLEAVLRMSRNELRVIAALKLQKAGDEWQIGVEARRFAKLGDTDENLAAAVKKAIDGAEGQRNTDQGGFILKSEPVKLEAVKQVTSQGILTYGGKVYTAEQLVRARVTKMAGDASVGAPIFLKRIENVLFEANQARLAHQTLRVDKLAQ